MKIFIKWQHLVIWFGLLSTRISKFNNSLAAWLPGKQAEQVRGILLILYSRHPFAHSFRKGQTHDHFLPMFTTYSRQIEHKTDPNTELNIVGPVNRQICNILPFRIFGFGPSWQYLHTTLSPMHRTAHSFSFQLFGQHSNWMFMNMFKDKLSKCGIMDGGRLHMRLNATYWPNNERRY